jgi:hypothetical protein
VVRDVFSPELLNPAGDIPIDLVAKQRLGQISFCTKAAFHARESVLGDDMGGGTMGSLWIPMVGPFVIKMGIEIGTEARRPHVSIVCRGTKSPSPMVANKTLPLVL